MIIADDNITSMSIAVSLAAALSVHPTLKRLELHDADATNSFSVLAVAFQQNKQLKHFGILLDEFLYTSEMNTVVRCMLETNSIEKLTIEIKDDDGQNLDLSGTLGGNTSLNALRVAIAEQDSNFVADTTMRDICHLLRGNQSMEVLELSKVGFEGGLVELVSLAASGHRSLKRLVLEGTTPRTELSTNDTNAIRTMLSAHSALREFEIRNFILDEDAVIHMVDGFKSTTCALEKIDLSTNQMDTDCLGLVAYLLSGIETLLYVNLEHNDAINRMDARSIARMLRQNSSIQTLLLAGNLLSPAALRILAQAIRHDNRSLKKLSVSADPEKYSDHKEFAEMLTENAVLETLHVGGLEERGLQTFVSYLPKMKGLKHLVLLDVIGFTASIAADFVKSLEENVSLETFKIQAENSEAVLISPRADYLLSLNRAGRRILRSPNVPSALWPLVLQRSNSDPDALFFFLREKPSDLIGPKKNVSRKRKRGEWFKSLLWG